MKNHAMVLEQIRRLVGDALQIEPEDITENTVFRDDLGADSLEVYQIVMAVEQEFDLELEQSMSDVRVRTVGELAERVTAAMKM